MPQTHSALDRLLVVLVLAMLLWLPLPMGSNRDWAVGVFVAGIGLISVLWALERWRQAGVLQYCSAWRAGRVLLSLLLLAQLWVAVQWLAGLSADAGATFQALILGLAYSLLFILILALFNTRPRLTLLLATLAVSGVMQAFYGAFMTLSGIEWGVLVPKTSYRGDATGTFINRNHLAGYLELTLACGIGLLLALRDDRTLSWRNSLELLLGPKARLRLGLVIMVIALVMTHSRGGNIGFFTGLLGVATVFIIRNREHRLRNSALLLSIVLIDVLIISQYFGLERLKDRLASTQLSYTVVDGEVVASANDLRLEVVQQSLALIKERPLLGQGAGSFEAVFQRIPDLRIPAHFDHAHNDYVQFALEFGLIGSLPLLLFALLALGHALTALWRAKSAYRSGVGFGAAMGIIALAVHSATDFNLQIPANAATFVVLCAIAILADHHSSRSRHHPLRNTTPRHNLP